MSQVGAVRRRLLDDDAVREITNTFVSLYGITLGEAMRLLDDCEWDVERAHVVAYVVTLHFRQTIVRSIT